MLRDRRKVVDNGQTENDFECFLLFSVALKTPIVHDCTFLISKRLKYNTSPSYVATKNGSEHLTDAEDRKKRSADN